MYVDHGGEAVPEPRTFDEEVAGLAALGGATLVQHGGGPRGLGVACLSIALAVIVRLAERLPQGAPERRALADAAKPLNDCLTRAKLLGRLNGG